METALAAGCGWNGSSQSFQDTWQPLKTAFWSFQGCPHNAKPPDPGWDWWLFLLRGKLIPAACSWQTGSQTHPDIHKNEFYVNSWGNHDAHDSATRHCTISQHRLHGFRPLQNEIPQCRPCSRLHPSRLHEDPRNHLLST